MIFKLFKYRLFVNLQPTVEKRQTIRSISLQKDPTSTGQIVAEMYIYEAYQPFRKINTIDSAALPLPLECTVNISTDPPRVTTT